MPDRVWIPLPTLTTFIVAALPFWSEPLITPPNELSLLLPMFIVSVPPVFLWTVPPEPVRPPT